MMYSLLRFILKNSVCIFQEKVFPQQRRPPIVPPSELVNSQISTLKKSLWSRHNHHHSSALARGVLSFICTTPIMRLDRDGCKHRCRPYPNGRVWCFQWCRAKRTWDTTWCQCTECMNGAFLLLATYYDHVEGRKMREAWYAYMCATYTHTQEIRRASESPSRKWKRKHPKDGFTDGIRIKTQQYKRTKAIYFFH